MERPKPEIIDLIAAVHMWFHANRRATMQDNDTDLRSQNDERLRSQFKIWGIDDVFDWKNIHDPD